MKTKMHPTKHVPNRMSGAARVTTARVPMKWRWHYRVLQTLRDQLLDEKAVELAEVAEPIERHSMDPADSATDEFDRALAVSLLSGEQDALHEVDAAIHRILSGTYGICEMTEERIPAKRLRAVPWTRLTREAQHALERVGVSRFIHLARVESIQGPVPGSLTQAGEPEREELPALEQGNSLGTFSRQPARSPGSHARNASPRGRRRGMR